MKTGEFIPARLSGEIAQAKAQGVKVNEKTIAKRNTDDDKASRAPSRAVLSVSFWFVSTPQAPSSRLDFALL